MILAQLKTQGAERVKGLHEENAPRLDGLVLNFP